MKRRLLLPPPTHLTLFGNGIGVWTCAFPEQCWLSFVVGVPHLRRVTQSWSAEVAADCHDALVFELLRHHLGHRNN